MAEHHSASIDAPVVPVGSSLTLSEDEHDGHRSDSLDLASLEHAYAALIDARSMSTGHPEDDATLDVALVAVYREICRRSTQSETVVAAASLRERIMAGLRVVGPVTMPRSDYGPDLATRARLARELEADYDAPIGAGESVEASRG